MLADALSFLRFGQLKKFLLARRAAKLSARGNALFYDKIPHQLQPMYQKDRALIDHFPLHLYHIVKLDRLGSFHIDSFDDLIKNQLMTGILWEEQIGQLIHLYAIPGTVAIDVGAHIGTHTLTMANAVGKKGRVYSFEPQRKLYSELCWNMALNNANNVFPMRLALGKKTDCIRLIQPFPNNEGATFAVPDSPQEDSSLQLKLDDFNLTNLSLIKIDVENMEADVIKGAVKTIRRCRPVMIVEIQGNSACSLYLKKDCLQSALATVKKILSLHYTVHHLNGCDFLCLPIS